MGRPVWIFWPGEKQWFQGSVKAFNGRKHHVSVVSVLSQAQRAWHQCCGTLDLS